MNQLLFTGANGFLGKNVLPLLKKEGYVVTTFDMANADVNANLSQEIPCFNKPYEVVIHAAGKAYGVSLEEPHYSRIIEARFRVIRRGFVAVAFVTRCGSRRLAS